LHLVCIGLALALFTVTREPMFGAMAIACAAIVDYFKL
jgi:hypothetical protein